MLRMFINMDQSIDRLTAIQEQLVHLGIDAERVSGVNGRLLTDSECEELTYPSNHFETKVRFTRDLTKGEIGCFLSHRKCWMHLLNSEEEWGLIFEDDMLFSEKAVNFILNENWIPDHLDVIQLHVTNPNEYGLVDSEKIQLDDQTQLVRQLRPIPLTTGCYLISRKAAQLALLLSRKLPAPVDNFLFSPWFEFASSMPVWNLYPAIAIARGVESEIGKLSTKRVNKAPFWIRHGLTRYLMDRRIKQNQKKGDKFLMTFK